MCATLIQTMSIPRKPAKGWKPSLNHQEQPAKKPKRLKFKEWQKHHVKLRRTSEKQKGLASLYAKRKSELGKGPFPCFVCGQPVTIGRDGSWHHPSGRRTAETIVYIEPTHEIPCHRQIHSRPGWALEMGYLTPEFFRSVK